jgi:hypothetical protein
MPLLRYAMQRQDGTEQLLSVHSNQLKAVGVMCLTFCHYYVIVLIAAQLSQPA